MIAILRNVMDLVHRAAEFGLDDDYDVAPTEATSSPSYSCHVVSRDTWEGVNVGDEYGGAQVAEGFYDRQLEVYVLVVRADLSVPGDRAP